mgnify:CR=1 FL=1
MNNDDWLKFAVTTLLGSGVFGWIVQHRLARIGADNARALESLKADLSVSSRLRSTALEKRAPVAAEVLVATLDLLDGIDLATSVFRIHTDPTPELGDNNRQNDRRLLVEARRKMLMPLYEDFGRKCVLAEVYLPDAVNDVLSEIKKLKWSIEVDQEMHAETMLHDRLEFYEKGFGEIPKKQVAALRLKAKSELRPLAQLSIVLSE